MQKETEPSRAMPFADGAWIPPNGSAVAGP